MSRQASQRVLEVARVVGDSGHHAPAAAQAADVLDDALCPSPSDRYGIAWLE